jgi:hypothetical protein
METMTIVRIFRRARALALALLCSSAPALAQHEHHQPTGDTSGWTWSASGQAFLTANLQERKFRDFHQIESQNWFMGTAARRMGPSTLTLHGMASLEPFTLRRLGSSQVFQTGETLDDAPLVDYQHPHDLIMGLSARMSTPARGARLFVSGGLVDAPALGPTAFMHRASAATNPTVPLAHHQLDSTHITPGVITAGVTRGAWTGEASLFRGREPDENRRDLDLGTLDSWSARIGWRRGGLSAQVSGARLRQPDAIELGDVTRLTTSMEYVGSVRGRDTALTLAWGHNRESFGRENAYFAEGVMRLSARGSVYSRAELVDKHILTAGGRHPPGFQHPHIFSRVGALTGGYLHRLIDRREGEIAIGADITGYRVPANLAEPYGRPVSIHVFLRWRAGLGT